MEQFRQIGKVVGSLKALMIFQDDIQINQRQCRLLVDMFTSAYKTVADQIKQNLRFEEKSTKWKIIEHPLNDLLKIFKEGEMHIRQCLETKNWWGKAISVYRNKDCVEFHIHNLLCCMPVVIEAIEMAGEISGQDHDEMQKKKVMYSLKYQKDWKDPRLFQWKFGKNYLVSQDFCNQLDSVWDEDGWFLLKKIQEKKKSGGLSSKHDQKLADIFLKNVHGSETMDDVLLPYETLVSSKDYQVRRRLGNGSQYKEIQWLGETFALRHCFGDIKELIPEIARESGLCHPNIMHVLCGFSDEEKKECFLVMELMERDLSTYIKELCGPRKRVPFSLPVAVDLMLQIARGMEYLHSKKIYHGDLKPSNILVKPRSVTKDGSLHAKVSGFGLSSSISLTQTTPKSPSGMPSFIWYAPEVLSEQEQLGMDGGKLKYTKKADIYSFGMICFELLTGKVPFEDSHLQGDKMSRNIRAGERPLFPLNSPKYLASLTKKCWHADPNQRPSFSSICRVLRYIKRFLILNPDHSQPNAPTPPVDFGDIEASIVRSFPYMGNSNLLPVSQIPFQIFAYRVTEKEKPNINQRDTSESGSSDETSGCADDNVTTDDSTSSPLPSPIPSKSPSPTPSPTPVKRCVSSPDMTNKRLSLAKKSLSLKTNKQPETPKGRSLRPPQVTPRGRSMRMKSESQLMLNSPRPWRTSGHVSDSEIS